MSWIYHITSALGSMTQAEMENNALEVYGQLYNYGWTVNAICAVLGNMQDESYINPAQTQNGYATTSMNGGYGLVMWSPARKIKEWLQANNHSLYSGYWQLYALNNEPWGVEYISTSEYPLSYDQFKHSGESLDYLTTAFLKNYERASVEHLDLRIENAENWYRYLMGEEPPEPSPTPPVPPDPPPEPTPDPSGYKGYGLKVWQMIRYHL